MAKIFYPDPVSDDQAVVITDLGFRSTEHTVETLDFRAANETLLSAEHKQRQAQLEVVDKLYGPLPIGAVKVTRSALDALGATTDGLPLTGDNTFFRIPNRFFLNSLQFCAADIETRITLSPDVDDYRLLTLLFEIASQRPPTARPLLRGSPDTQAEPTGYRSSLEKLLNAAQRLNLHAVSQTMSWVSQAKSTLLIPTGLGLQAFGIYSGLRGLQDAIQNRDAYQTVFNGAGVAAEMASIGVEAAVTRQATQMIKAGQSALGDFAKTGFAIRLARGSGLIASVLTLPFDIIAAVDSFKAAARATGKEATDHYVSASLSVTSAAMSLTLGIAALAGFSSAGPVGLAAGLILVVGSQIWGAIRQVDEIDDYIELTVHERLRTGWLAFWAISPDKDIQDRYTLAKATAEHTKLLRANALYLLKGPLKDSTEAIVNGAFTVELEPVTYTTWNWWTGEKYQATTVRPRIKDSDDWIDARSGVTAQTPGAVIETSAEDKGIHWYVGGGNDTVLGTENQPNVFHYGAGVKKLTGGVKDDVFIFEGSAEPLSGGQATNTLVGGLGNDTLILSGRTRNSQEPRLGYQVDLEAGQVSIITQASHDTEGGHYRHAVLEGIENVEIPEGGTNVIKGTAGSNIIKSRGNDSIEAGAGNDRIFILTGNNRNADGGPGDDAYAIAHKPGGVSISEDGVDSSVIALDWRADLIESWQIEESHLVITSCFDASDGEFRKVTIRNVYDNTDNPRTLQNNRLTFITRDGYHLVPDLPDTIEHSGPLDIETMVVQQGIPRNPAILKDRSEQQVAHDKDTSYYVSRINELTTLKVKQKSKFSTTLHLDYLHCELTRIEAHYSVHVTQEDERDTLKYGECGLTLHFGARRVVLKNLASSDERYSAQNKKTGRRAFSALGSHHTFILIMNDGSSYRLVQPSSDYGLLLDETFIGKDPVQWKTDASLSLMPTKKNYPFLQPSDKPPHSMGSWATCAMLTSPTEQTGIEVLIGEGATYLVHLSPDMTIRLSTPGALAGANPRLPHASTWELDARHLGQVEIKLSSNLLQIGAAIIHLPVYGAEDLVDQVRVITAQGVVYAVDSLFERVYVEALDGRYFAPLTDPSAGWPSALSSLTSAELKVLHIAVKDGSPGTLSYNLKTRKWTLDTDKSRVIEVANLRKTNLCEHALKIYQDLAREGLNQNPPMSDDALRLLREKCTELMESFTFGHSVMFARALALSAAFGIRLSQLSWLLSLGEASPKHT
ncbi:calcium-binding protein [Pseudomonas sp. G2-4]|uniref:calcium-binding protein n=1 Tax=Pseudomonas sp. G2-4 TaxID=1506334 RepID=UPI0024BB0EC0|nr:calcium-binding protein [Pseudomonas sp. G2-4]WHS58909.1 calcium-binding protein [Pseudomonas sp. G2-4]